MSNPVLTLQPGEFRRLPREGGQPEGEEGSREGTPEDAGGQGEGQAAGQSDAEPSGGSAGRGPTGDEARSEGGSRPGGGYGACGDETEGELPDLDVAPETTDIGLSSALAAHVAAEAAKVQLDVRPWSVSPRAAAADTEEVATAGSRHTLDGHRAHTGTVRQELTNRLSALLWAESRTRPERNLRSGRLDSTRLARVALGGRQARQVFYRERRASRTVKVGIAVLVDRSGSMSGTKARLAVQSAIALGDALSPLSGRGLKFGILGFRTAGRMDRSVLANHRADRQTPVEHRVYKGFEEPWAKAAIRVAGMRFGGGNSDGDAVLWAARLLANLGGVDRRVLVVLSDGQPTGSQDMIRSGAHLEGAVRLTESAGIETVGIGILSRAVCSYYDHHEVVAELGDLPGAITRAVEHATR